MQQRWDSPVQNKIAHGDNANTNSKSSMKRRYLFLHNWNICPETERHNNACRNCWAIDDSTYSCKELIIIIERSELLRLPSSLCLWGLNLHLSEIPQSTYICTETKTVTYTAKPRSPFYILLIFWRVYLARACWSSCRISLTTVSGRGKFWRGGHFVVVSPTLETCFSILSLGFCSDIEDYAMHANAKGCL